MHRECRPQFPGAVAYGVIEPSIKTTGCRLHIRPAKDASGHFQLISFELPLWIVIGHYRGVIPYPAFCRFVCSEKSKASAACWRCGSTDVVAKGHPHRKDAYVCKSCGRYFTLPVERYRYRPVPQCRTCGALLNDANWAPSLKGNDRYVCKNCYRPYQREMQKVYLVTMRRRLLALLGDVCVCGEIDCWHTSKCTVADFRALQIDHINGGGRRDSAKKSAGGRSREMYLYYLKHPDEAKQELQVLCANCNWVKVVRNNERKGPMLLPPV